MTAKFKNRFLTINKKKIEIVRLIGSGSLGGVWEIKNELGYPKALKVLYKLRNIDGKKFLEKLQILKKISHPNLLKIETVGFLNRHNLESLLDDANLEGSLEEVPFFTMPYAAINLADYIVLHKENILERLKLSLHLCSAIRKIHHLKVYNEQKQVESLSHGNLKLSNFLLVIKNNTYSLRIGDLGIDPSLGVQEQDTRYTTARTDDFVEAESALRELLLPGISLEDFPKIEDSRTLEIWIDKLRSLEQKMRREKTARSFLHLGIKLYGQSSYQYAMRDFDKAISLEENLYEAHLYKGLTHQELEQLEQAEKCYHKAISIDKKDARAYENMGELSLIQDEEDKAISWFEKSVELNNEMPFSHANLGNLYKNKQRFADAITSFSHLITLEDDCAPAYIDRGDVYFSLAKYQDARQDYQKALELESDSEEVKAKLALTEEKLKES